MRDRLHWGALILGTAAFFAVLIQVPQVLHVLDDRYQGVLVALNSDESVYLARVQEALSGRPAMTAEAFIGDPRLQGTQLALLEEWYGRLFSWTDLRAAEVLQIMDSINVFLLFILLWMFLRLCGFSLRHALIGACLFVIIELYNLNRPVHLAGSTALTLASIVGMMLGVRFRIMFGIAGGVLLGTLVGVYVWSWMWAWTAWGVLLLIAIAEPDRGASGLGWRKFVSKEVQRLLLFGFVGLVFALPHGWHLWSLSQHPLYEQAVFRSGMHPGRAPESWPYSILFTAMVVCVLAAYRRDPSLRRYQGALMTIATAWIVIHQQAVHGIVFNYVSHELLLLVISALSVLLLWWVTRTRLLLVGACAAAVYLAAVAYDGRFVIKQMKPTDGRFAEQHLAAALPLLDALPRTTILSSIEGSSFIAGQTHHDVVYSVYLKNVLLSHEQIAERYCLTVLPVAAQDRRISDQKYLIYPDADAAFAADPTVREREVAMVERACEAFDRHPQEALEKFGVTHVFWDERNDPKWELSRLGSPLKRIFAGEGWSLWKVER